MNPYANEDVMWQRLKDVQREAENRRLYSPHTPSALDAVRMFGRRAWILAGLAIRRPAAPAVDTSARESRSKIA